MQDDIKPIYSILMYFFSLDAYETSRELGFEATGGPEQKNQRPYISHSKVLRRILVAPIPPSGVRWLIIFKQRGSFSTPNISILSLFSFSCIIALFIGQ